MPRIYREVFLKPNDEDYLDYYEDYYLLIPIYLNLFDNEIQFGWIWVPVK